MKYQISNIKYQISKKSQQGISLVELIIYMGLFSILLLVFLQMFSSLINTQLESQATSGVTADGMYIVNRLTYDVRRSSSIVTPAIYGLTGNTLRITGSGIDNSYTLANGNLQLTDNIAVTTDVLNSINSSVTSLTFIKLGTTSSKSTVQLMFTLTSKAIKQTGAETRSFQTTIGTR